MTELETMQRAKMYMDKLAQGIDPITNQEIPEDSTLNNVRLARCFFYVSGILGQVIANGGNVGAKPQIPFAILPEQLATIEISEEPIRITQLIDRISSAVGNPQMKKLQTTAVTDWLLEKGFLEKMISPDGKYKRLPTQSGLMIGLSVRTRQSPRGEYQAVYYNADAQQFVLEHLEQMLQEKA